MVFRDIYNTSDNGALKLHAETLDQIDFSALFHAADAAGHDLFYWDKPSGAYRFLALHRLLEVAADGKDRSLACDERISPILASMVSDHRQVMDEEPPVFLGAMKFAYGRQEGTWEDFHDSDWFVPRYLYLQAGDRCYFLFYYLNESSAEAEILMEEGRRFAAADKPETPATVPGLESEVQGNYRDWAAKVNEILGDIATGIVSKIVLSRFLKFRMDGPVSTAYLMETLAERYRDCYIFSFRKKGSLFFGASPEKLAAMHAGIIEADALAGSMPRGSDRNEDDRLGQALLSSEKNLAEQQAVVRFITDSFSEFTCSVEAPDKPVLRKLPNIQHLWTPIHGKLCPGYSVMHILSGIHPTPAICGVPWTTARKRILQIEDYNRGLYSGLLGWFGRGYEGEFAVSIRSALIKDSFLYAFAGCGIVSGSDPLSEYQESELKLKPMTLLFPREE